MPEQECCPECAKSVLSRDALTSHLDWGHQIPDPVRHLWALERAGRRHRWWPLLGRRRRPGRVLMRGV